MSRDAPQIPTDWNNNSGDTATVNAKDLPFHSQPTKTRKQLSLPAPQQTAPGYLLCVYVSVCLCVCMCVCMYVSVTPLGFDSGRNTLYCTADSPEMILISLVTGRLFTLVKQWRVCVSKWHASKSCLCVRSQHSILPCIGFMYLLSSKHGVVLVLGLIYYIYS